MDNEESFINDFSKLEGSLINAEDKFGVNPLELWMNEMIERKRQKDGEKNLTRYVKESD